MITRQISPSDCKAELSASQTLANRTSASRGVARQTILWEIWKVPTQVIAEYLASLDDPTLDGMIYPSVQAAMEMKNVVLFHKAAVVAKVKRPEGVKFIVRDYENYEEGPEIEYGVREEFDSEAPSVLLAEPTMDDLIAEVMAEEHSIVDRRVPALELSTENVWVHHIKSVVTTSDRHHVSRRESDLKDLRAFEERMKRRPQLTLEQIPNDF